MQNAKVSIIVCAYNSEKYIEKCLDSVLAQDYPLFDVIVVDDASEDNTRAVLKKYGNNEKIKIFRNPVNLGVMGSRNTGLSKSDGSIVAFIDADSTAGANWITELIGPFEKADDIVMVGGRIDDPPSSNYWGLVMKGYTFIAPEAGYVQYILGGNMAFKRDFLEKNRFDETLKYGADEIDLCLSASSANKKIFYQDSAKVMHYHKNSFLPLVRQRFLAGISNYHVRLKNKVFPFLSLKTSVLLLSIIFYLLHMMGAAGGFLSAFFIILYLGRIIFEDAAGGRKNFIELFLSSFGRILLTVVWSAGNIFGVFYIPALKNKASRDC